MDNEEINKELAFSYDGLVEYLLKKYGAAKYDYFVNESCKTKNRKVTRTEEGLFCHHIDEDKAIMLSSTEWAIKNPFDYQKAERLVYCNALEHLILHTKIAAAPKKDGANERELQGIGGAINFLIPELNHCYSGFKYKRPYEQRIYGLISDSFDGYINILKYFADKCFGDRYRLSLDVNGVPVGRVFDALCQG